MTQLIQKIREPWGIMRIARMAIAMVIMTDAAHSESWFLFGLGLLFAYQAVANIGCLACNVNGSCNTPNQNKQNPYNSDLEVEYEEISEK